MDDEEHARRGQRARQLLEDPLWQEAWTAYRTRLLEIIEATDSAQTEALLQAKRLLTAGTAAKVYLERLIVDGKVSAATIQAEETRKKWYQRRSA